MSTPASSTSLRAHVDAGFDPTYERLFAALDLLLVHQTRHRTDTARILELRAVLKERLAELDRGDRSERAGGGEVPAEGAWRWWS